MASVHHPNRVEDVAQLIRERCVKGEPWGTTCRLRGKDGTYRWFLLQAAPIRGSDGELLGWLGTDTDVTDQKHAEAERERLLALEQEVAYQGGARHGGPRRVFWRSWPTTSETRCMSS